MEQVLRAQLGLTEAAADRIDGTGIKTGFRLSVRANDNGHARLMDGLMSMRRHRRRMEFRALQKRAGVARFRAEALLAANPLRRRTAALKADLIEMNVW
jgi:hypothetical protein